MGGVGGVPSERLLCVNLTTVMFVLLLGCGCCWAVTTDNNPTTVLVVVVVVVGL